MQRTGHRSVAGVRAYKVPSEDMLKQVSNCLQPPSNDISPASLNAQSLNAHTCNVIAYFVNGLCVIMPAAVDWIIQRTNIQ